jgi:alpha-mannosidase
MKRRHFLKNLAGLLYGSAAIEIPSGLQEKEQPSSTAIAVRGLIERDGTFFQPIRLPVPHMQDLKAIIRIDGDEFSRPVISAAGGVSEVHAPAIESQRVAEVSVEIAGNSNSWRVTLKPVRKVLVYVLPHSHTDIGYTDIQTDVEDKQVQNLKQGIEFARRTCDYPVGSRFVWNVEVLWAADLFMRRASVVEKAEFIDAVKQGFVGLNGMYTNELTGLCRPEELLQLFRYSSELADQCGVRIDSAMLSDVPGFTWGTATAMAKAGIRYFSVAPNWFDRIGALMKEWQDKPFWWFSPSGRDKVLVWVPWTGYAMSHVVGKATEKWVGDYQDRLEEVNFPYDISHIRWSGHGDNAAPDLQVSEFFKEWNTKYAWPKFVISSTSTAFRAFDERHGAELPEFKGDLTPFWEDGAGSSAFETAMNRNSADRLVQAAALFAILAPEAYPMEKFHVAWKNVLLYSEHTWGAWNSVSDSENKFVKDQWAIKQSFAAAAETQSRELLGHALSARSGPATVGRTGKLPSEVDIYNTTSWPRAELVVVSKELSAAGDRVTDGAGKQMPSQRLSTGELAIWVSEIPPFGAIRYKISPGKAGKPELRASIKASVLDNGHIRIRTDPATGGISEMYMLSREENLVDTSAGEQINGYLFLTGDNLGDLQTSGPTTTAVEENGPLVATLRIESEAPGCNKLVRRVRVIAGADYVELTNVVDKKRAPLNPHPREEGPSQAWAQRGGKESLQFAFPFNIKHGQMRMDIPWTVMRPETDQLAGACKNWLPVGRWIDIANEASGVTWVTLDAPLVEVGEISARLLGSQRNPDVWRKHIEPTQKFYSLVMNNHWGTNYRAYEEDVVMFRYAVRPHKEYDPAAAARFATGLSQPLIAAPAIGKEELRGHLLRVEPVDVLVTALKPSDDGNAWIVRLFGASGEDRQVRLNWSSPEPKAVWLSDTSEKPVARAGATITVSGWELVTLRVCRA